MIRHQKMINYSEKQWVSNTPQIIHTHAHTHTYTLATMCSITSNGGAKLCPGQRASGATVLGAVDTWE
eukprot:m.90973 g.90973  ORF g.90973 m.90973 type:complete len:68 (+) comp8858_c2_seq2:267-470(+)